MGVDGAPELVLLTREKCHLCHEMEAVLDEVLPRLGLEYTELDVDTSAELAERFGEVIPVLLRNGKPVAKIRLTPGQLERIVKRRRGLVR